MFTENEIQKSLVCKKSIFWWRTVLKGMLTIFNRLKTMESLEINGKFT